MRKKKRCPKGHIVTQSNMSQWYCGMCVKFYPLSPSEKELAEAAFKMGRHQGSEETLKEIRSLGRKLGFAPNEQS